MTRLAAMLTGLLFAASSTVSQPSFAGSFYQVSNCDDRLGCSAGFPESDPGDEVPPFAIAHPLGYEREGGRIVIPICVSRDDPALIPPTQRAIDTWNALTATTQNCLRCRVWEEPLESPDQPFHAESAILHELGHCAMALDHVNRPFDENDDNVHEPRSFTRSSDTIDIDIGPDGIRGSCDDEHFEPPPPPGNLADSVSWFRTADNDPVIVDETPIDADTYSRSVTNDLPSGHSWAANGNRVVAEALGEPLTQAVMYDLLEPGQQYSGLSADEVNMVKMGMTGEDVEVGTPDDYTVNLVYVEDCDANPSAIRVRFLEFDPEEPAAAVCVGLGIDYAFPPPNPLVPLHFELVTLMPDFVQIRLDSNLCWDTGPPIPPLVFMDGFESGDFSEWDDVVQVAGGVGRASLASWQRPFAPAVSARGRLAPMTAHEGAIPPGHAGSARRTGADSRSIRQRAGTCPPLEIGGSPERP